MHKRNLFDTNELGTETFSARFMTYSLLPKISEGHLKLKLLLGKRLDFLNEVLKCRLEFVSHFALHLLGIQVVSVVHVLVLAQVCCDLSHLGVKLYICVALFPKHDGILREEEKINKTFWIVSDCFCSFILGSIITGYTGSG